MEETIAYNTIGSVIHDTLEELYKPCENKLLLKEGINGMLKIKDKIVDRNFQKIFNLGNLNKGKNLIIVETAKRYIENFFKKEQDVWVHIDRHRPPASGMSDPHFRQIPSPTSLFLIPRL